jgi:hypothetical protein
MDETLYKLIVCPAGPGNIRNSEGDIVELADGKLLLAWTKFYSDAGEDHSPSIIAGKLSGDRGRTWSEEFVIQENVALQNVMSVTLRRLHSGEIALFYTEKNSDDDTRWRVRFSGDETRTWSDPVLVNPLPGYFVLNNDRVTQLADGRLLAPMAAAYEPGQPGVWPSTVFYSDDNGRTWRHNGQYLHLPGAGAQEPGIIELRDGRLMMICRTSLNRIYRAYSADRGLTWTDMEPMDLVAPCSPCCCKRIPATGDLLMVWNENGDETLDGGSRRTPLTCALSSDDGQTWHHKRNIEPDPARTYGYTSLTFVDDTVVLTYYSSPAGSIVSCDLKLCIVPVSWLYR